MKTFIIVKRVTTVIEYQQQEFEAETENEAVEMARQFNWGDLDDIEDNVDTEYEVLDEIDEDEIEDEE